MTTKTSDNSQHDPSQVVIDGTAWGLEIGGERAENIESRAAVVVEIRRLRAAVRDLLAQLDPRAYTSAEEQAVLRRANDALAGGEEHSPGPITPDRFTVVANLAAAAGSIPWPGARGEAKREVLVEAARRWAVAAAADRQAAVEFLEADRADQARYQVLTDRTERMAAAARAALEEMQAAARALTSGNGDRSMAAVDQATRSTSLPKPMIIRTAAGAREAFGAGSTMGEAAAALLEGRPWPSVPPEPEPETDPPAGLTRDQAQDLARRFALRRAYRDASWRAEPWVIDAIVEASRAATPQNGGGR